MQRHLCFAIILMLLAGIYPADFSAGGAEESLIATGLGKMPPNSLSSPQAKLMAKRAAMLEAYKNLAGMLGMADTEPVEGSGTEHVRGFIKGARLKETRYYADGDVEVDVELPNAHGVPAAAPAREKNKPLVVEKGGGMITESEWREIFGRNK